jgi:hypothetical protein
MGRKIDYTTFRKKSKLNIYQKKKCLALYYELVEQKSPYSISMLNLASLDHIIYNKLQMTEEDLDCFRLELGKRANKKSMEMYYANAVADEAMGSNMKGFIWEEKEY